MVTIPFPVLCVNVSLRGEDKTTFFDSPSQTGNYLNISQCLFACIIFNVFYLCLPASILLFPRLVLVGTLS